MRSFVVFTVFVLFWRSDVSSFLERTELLMLLWFLIALIWAIAADCRELFREIARLEATTPNPSD